MTPSRDGFPAHTTITRTIYPDDPPAAVPLPLPRRRLSHVGSSGCTLMQEIFDDATAADPHYSDVDLHREREAARLTREAADSILYGAFPGRGTNEDLRLASAARAASERQASRGGNR